MSTECLEVTCGYALGRELGPANDIMFLFLNQKQLKVCQTMSNHVLLTH